MSKAKNIINGAVILYYNLKWAGVDTKELYDQLADYIDKRTKYTLTNPKECEDYYE
jgi:hypothetical protein